MHLTIVICTYLRDELLATTLESLCKQTACSTSYTILVVDNACAASARRIAERFGVRYVCEMQLGHSHSRNQGMKCAPSDWILYLDDDVRVPPTLVERFLHHLQVADYAALGGRVEHWLPEPVPRWLRKYYRQPYRPSSQTKFGPLPDECYLIGCLIAVHRSAWEAVGGFSDEVGMHGMAIGRADEDEFQQRLRGAGFRVYYDPTIYIDHLVQPYKYTILGQVRLAYASGRDGVGIRGEQVLDFWGLITRYALITGYSLPFNLARWLLKPGYYWQNAVVDSLTKYAFAWGQYRTHRNSIHS